MGTDLENQKWNGYILFLPFAKGSKSESIRPFLVCDSSQIHLLFVSGDNPFSNESLKEYHRSFCAVLGKYDEGRNVILVESVETLEDNTKKETEPE
jgi:hypothetical protein